jgi:WD40 repeat protein
MTSILRCARATASVIAIGVALGASIASIASARAGDAAAKPVSFFREVRPILQAQCAGCHQNAKAGGHVVLSGFAELMRGDKNGEPLLVAGQPDQSELVQVVTSDGGDPPKMPKKRPPLTAAQLDTLKRWIAEGAKDDTPAAAREQFSMEQPPVYRQPPVVTSIDFSPDGQLLAVSGYHEALLFDAQSHALVARLVGLSERIQTVRFSPDGATLLVAGGSPARLGEIQLWNVAERKLRLSIPVGFDTLYGGSWSPDGKLVAFGGGDNIVRALATDTGEPVLFQGAHEDLVLDTTFSLDGAFVVSVSRDRSMKLIEVKTQQFVDNITSITPGALKGGLISVERQPMSDVLLVGGADGAPRTYQMHRTKDRKIGDDYNLIKAYAALAGRVSSVRWNADGKRFAVGATLLGNGGEAHGEVRLYAVDQEQPAWTLQTDAAIYTVSFHPQGKVLAAGGFDGQVLFLDTASGQVTQRLRAAPITP